MQKRRRRAEIRPMDAALRESLPGLVAVLVFGVVANVLKFAVPLYLLEVFDRVPAALDTDTLVKLTAITLAAVAAVYAMQIVRRRLLTGWGVWLERRFGPPILQRGLKAGLSAGHDVPAALADVTRLRTFLSDHATDWLDLIWVPLFLFGVFVIHPALGGLAAISLVVLLVARGLRKRAVLRARRPSRLGHVPPDAVVDSALRNRESVRALSMATALAGRWGRLADARLSDERRLLSRRQMLQSVLAALGDIMRIAMIALGLFLVTSGALSLGGVFAALVMASFGYALAERAVLSWSEFREARRAFAAVSRDLVRARTGPSAQPGTERAPLKIEAVGHGFGDDAGDLFTQLSGRLEPGELLLIEGRSGTGKSTLARLIAGLMPPRDGQIQIGGVETCRLCEALRAEFIGYMPQQTELFHGTIAENIARMEDASMSGIIEAAQLVGLHDAILALPDGYDTRIGPDSDGALSGSQRTRVALARAFYKKPRLIVLDQPTANLDGPSRRKIESAIRSLKKEGCMAVVTFSLAPRRFARLANKTVTLGPPVPEIVKPEPPAKPAQKPVNRPASKPAAQLQRVK